MTISIFENFSDWTKEGEEKRRNSTLNVKAKWEKDADITLYFLLSHSLKAKCFKAAAEEVCLCRRQQQVLKVVKNCDQ